MLKLIRSIVTSSFQHPRIIKKLNHNCCKISLRSLIILTRESKGGKKKKKKICMRNGLNKSWNRILSKPEENHILAWTLRTYHWRKTFSIHSLPYVFLPHTSHTLKPEDLQRLVSVSTVKRFHTKEKHFSHSPNTLRTITQAKRLSIFSHLPQSIQPPCMHACMHCTRPRIVRLCTCIVNRAVLLRHEFEWVPHPPRAQAWYVGDTSMPRMRRKSGSVSNGGDFEAARSCSTTTRHGWPRLALKVR